MQSGNGDYLPFNSIVERVALPHVVGEEGGVSPEKAKVLDPRARLI